jgi:hypothetical protein
MWMPIRIDPRVPISIVVVVIMDVPLLVLGS